MPQYINTNMAALNSQRSLSTSQNALALSLQRLSSGMRINSAKDDAAGMAIASRMTSQISGLGQAVRNANDGISLAQTAEGAMNTITDNLQRMRDLSVQASNASATATDRVSINNEIQQLSAEIQRVSASTNFNGTKLLDGSFNAQTFQVGANQGDTVNIPSIANMQTTQLGEAGTSFVAKLTGGVTTQSLVPGSLTLNGSQVGASQAGLAAGQSASSAFSIASAINAVSGTSGVTATANATTLIGAAPTSNLVAPAVLFPTTIPANSFSINGINVGAIAGGGNAGGQGTNVAAAINQISSQTGVTATADATTGKVTLTAADGRNISITENTGYFGNTPIAPAVATTLLQDTGLSATSSDIVVGALPSSAVGATVVSMSVNGVPVPLVNPPVILPPATNTIQENAAAFVLAFNAAALLPANSGIAGITASSDANGVISLSSNGTVPSINIASEANSGFATRVGATYSAQHGTISLSSSSSSGIVQAGGAAGSAGFDPAGTATLPTTVANVNSIASLNTLTSANAQAAITTIDGALAKVNTARGELGAFQNRFASAVANMQITSENLTSSRSRIQDTDFAAETGALSRAQILQQAGTAMLAQANSSPNGVMALLR